MNNRQHGRELRREKALAVYIRLLLLAAAVILVLIATAVIVRWTGSSKDDAVTEEQVRANMERLYSAQTIIEPEDTMHIVPDTTVDWEEVMVRACITGNRNAGENAQFQMQKLCDIEVRDEPPLVYEDVVLLAKIIEKEQGVGWPDSMVIALGEVVLNRLASPEYPDDIRSVLYATGPIQYEPVYDAGWEEFLPSERSVRLAIRLLKGERVLHDPRIVYQALFEQGTGTVMTYHDFILGTTTFFCLTDHPEMYG